MFMTNRTLHSAAMAAILALPLAAAPAFAQTAETGQTAEPEGQSPDVTQQAQAAAPEGTTVGDPMGAPAPDAIVATVGDAEIRGADVMSAIGMLPPQVQAQPPQMLAPIALEQLILRELILQEAQSQNLAEDPEVTQLVEQTVEDAQANAMVQVWLERETADAVSDETVQQYYDEAKAQGGEEFPPLEEVRPQIEQHLRQQQMVELRTNLREGANVVLYDPAGQPIEQPAGADTAGAAPSGQADLPVEGAAGSAADGSTDRPTEGPVDTPTEPETQPAN
ncbi:hypothetical protein [Paracoccus beibuensis]|uniref:hypothetical protein n=1 Tax=Paracoccus beibuensis TaxID=547602 RepID=UPI00223FB856|nr:hypothetical protein [Paracoccus beibuensis]